MVTGKPLPPGWQIVEGPVEPFYGQTPSPGTLQYMITGPDGVKVNVKELACAHVRLGGRHGRRHLSGFLTICLDITAGLTEIRAKGLARFAVPVAEAVMDLLKVVAQPLQGLRPVAGRLEHLVDRISIPALDVRRGQ